MVDGWTVGVWVGKSVWRSHLIVGISFGASHSGVRIFDQIEVFMSLEKLCWLITVCDYYIYTVSFSAVHVTMPGLGAVAEGGGISR